MREIIRIFFVYSIVTKVQKNMDNNGEKLKKMRKKCGLSIQEVEKATNIREHIIEALEKNEEISLPMPYIVSFVKSLNEFYEKKLSSSDKKTTEEAEVSPIIYDDQENVFKVKEEYAKNRIFINDIDENDKEEEDNSIEKNEGFEIIETKDIEQETTTITTKNNINNKKHKESKSNEEKEKVTVAPVISVDEKPQQKKKKQIRYKSINSKKSIYIVYSVLGLFLLSIIYFIFFYGSKDVETLSTELDDKNAQHDKKTNKKNTLLLQFTQDSISFTAIAKDSAWIKLDIDGKKVDELIMAKGDRQRWAAQDYFVLSTSNVGSIDFYKNDSLLPLLGAAGSMVKNIKIAKDGLANVRPLESHTQTVPMDKIDTNYMNLAPSTAANKDTTKKKVYRRKKVEKEERTIPILDFSAPPTTKPNILDKPEKEKEKK